MKLIPIYLTVLFSFLFSGQSLQAQDGRESGINPNTPAVIYDSADVDLPAFYYGGMRHFCEVLADTFEYPERCKFDGVYVCGSIRIQMVVSAKGKVTDIQVLQGCTICPDWDVALVKAIIRTQGWYPAMRHGAHVNSRIKFTLNLLKD